MNVMTDKNLPTEQLKINEVSPEVLAKMAEFLTPELKEKIRKSLEEDKND